MMPVTTTRRLFLGQAMALCATAANRYHVLLPAVDDLRPGLGCYGDAFVRDFTLAEALYPGWLKRLLTHPVAGLDHYRELFRFLTEPHGAMKVYCEIAEM